MSDTVQGNPAEGGQHQFDSVPPARPGYSSFDLSYDKKFTCDMGELIPILCEEVLPGDIWMIGNLGVIRMQPLVAPILHEVNVYFHYFFVPNRIMWSSWETFITGGILGDDSTALPRWAVAAAKDGEGSLWDYMGFPTEVQIHADNLPVDFGKRAYNHVYNQWYRDENLITAIDPDTSEDVKLRCWQKDFFTSALPWLQRGTAPALPISLSGTIEATGIDENITVHAAGGGEYGYLLQNSTEGDIRVSASASTNPIRWTNSALEIDLSEGQATSFNINDLRLAMQLQKYMERNARAGVRYIEHITAHFGNVAPTDSRLQRPEYIGGSKAPVVISEVLQTSGTGTTGQTTPQGNLAGHGISVIKQFCAKYRAVEHGIIIGIMSIMPKPVYQQGVDRQWLKQTRYDYYSPEFANLGEQAIQRVELFASSVKADNETIFGYQGRWDEYRQKRSMVCGELRSTLDHWHLSRQFASGADCVLNQTFVECVPRKDCFAVPASDGFICNIGNIIKAIRPMPLMSEPGIQR